ncbi:MAG: hypothetical protein CBB68_07035 [Rhodospirillaceae bacterium TMED8]|nr:hypothetical protein [Magnetovibrio sp.]OUT50748.1 MAG: hypothetical protein CBB68_07035 [Rhodospirillaceae bacterium TMED8]
MGTLGQRVLRNTLALGGAQIVTLASGVVTTVVFARALGPVNYGIIGFGIALISYLGLLTNMGMDVHGVREIPRSSSHGRRLTQLIISTRLIFAGLLFVCLFFVSPYLGWPAMTRNVILIQGVGILGVALTVDFYFQAEQRMGIAALRQSSAAILGAVLVLALVSDASDIYLAASIPIIVNVFTALILLLYFWSYSKSNSAPQGELSRKKFVRKAAPLALMGILMTMYLNMDIIILGYLVNEYDLGLYVAATRISLIAMVIPNLLHSAFLPALSKVRDDDLLVLKAAENHARTVSFFGGAVGGAGVVLAPILVNVFFGDSFKGADSVLIILMVYVFLFHIAACFGTPLVAWQCDKPYMVIMIVSVALNVGLNFFLIPIFGITGAAVATLITQFVICIGVMVAAHKALGIKHYGLIARAVIITTLAVGVFCAGSYMWPTWSEFDSFIALIGGGGIYVSIYLAFALSSGMIKLSELRRLTTLYAN